jgi:hypothetical protein
MCRDSLEPTSGLTHGQQSIVLMKPHLTLANVLGGFSSRQPDTILRETAREEQALTLTIGGAVGDELSETNGDLRRLRRSLNSDLRSVVCFCERGYNAGGPTDRNRTTRPPDEPWMPSKPPPIAGSS